MDGHKEFKSARCGIWDDSDSIDQSVTTNSWCDEKWTGHLKPPANITEISLTYLKWNKENIPKVSVGMKGKQFQSCESVKQTTSNFYRFNCVGHPIDTVEIELDGYLFDVKAFC